MIIAVDGSAASGKGTLARRLAAHYNLAHLDTGALYRCLALHLLGLGHSPDNIAETVAADAVEGLDLSAAGTSTIRTDAVAGMASIVAAMPSVRQNFLTFQRRFSEGADGYDGAILDGRDIGTVILPDADFKFFIDADLEERAGRRTRELQDAGQSVMFRDVLEDMRDRDRRDRERRTAPLMAADGAMIIDTTRLDAEGVLAVAVGHIETHRGQEAKGPAD